MEQDSENPLEENTELMALQKIDETAVNLQKEGRFLEALDTLERGLVLRQHFFGMDSEEVWNACKTVGEMCNLLAMTYLQQEDYSMTLDLLKKAEILTERDPAAKAVTYNNFACYYRKQGKLHSALTYLERALKIEESGDIASYPADTHLNLCPVLSQLGRHSEALEHAQTALIMLQEELFTVTMTNNNSNNTNNNDSSSNSTADAKVEQRADRISVLAIAYHNIGVEQEFLKKYDRSLQAYKKGVEIAENYLGSDHGITITLRNSYIAAKKSLSNKPGMNKETDRKESRKKIATQMRKTNTHVPKTDTGFQAAGIPREKDLINAGIRGDKAAKEEKEREEMISPRTGLLTDA